MINVTKTYLPPIEEYTSYLKGIWDRSWVTNYGPLFVELEAKLKEYLGIDYLSFCSNGTVALEVALKALEIKEEVITTPFSYVATTNSIIWENCTPVFVDIRKDDLCLDASKIEEKITSKTTAIMAVHVYGYPCDVDAIDVIAKKYNLKVIYDAAHAFGVKYKGKSLLSYGDISTCSFHATKLFHTIEGGAIVSNSTELAKKIKLMTTFGHEGDNYYSVGINGKNSEFHAAIGLCILPKIDDIIKDRKKVSSLYDSNLNFSDFKLTRPQSHFPLEYNYAYYPVIFESEEKVLEIRKLLIENDINTRRYFYPSLNELPFITYDKCEISEDIARRVLSLPLYVDIESEMVMKICNLINSKL